jgi:DNA-binding response OmpR family regulator
VSSRDDRVTLHTRAAGDVSLGDTPDGTSTQPAARIVLVSDDEQLRSLLCGLLNAHGYRGVVSVDARSVLEPKKQLAEWDIAVVDTSVSYDDTIRVLRQLKNTSAATIAIFAKRDSAAASRELLASTDVLLGKPFDPRELLLVIRGMLGDNGDAVPQRGATVSAGPITLSTLLNQAIVASREIELTGVEAQILLELVINASSPVTRERLMRRALLRSPDTRSLDTHVSRLRRKIGSDRRGRTPIRTVRGVGYLLVEHWEPSQ